MDWPKISKDTPLTEVKRIHQAIWDYVIEHGKKPDTPYRCDCAGCEYDSLYEIKFEGCTHEECERCPIYWPETEETGNKHFCVGVKKFGLFDKWLCAKGEEKVEIAHQIRDLPFKYELDDNKNL